MAIESSVRRRSGRPVSPAVMPRALRARTLTVATLSLALLGCAGAPRSDEALAGVVALTAPHLKQELEVVRSDADLDAIARRTDALLSAGPLGTDAAVQVALLNHRGMQAGLQDLGIAAADLAQAGRLPNPGFRFGRLTRGDEREYERSISLDLGHLLLMPLVRQAESRRFDETQRRVAMDVLALVAEVRRAHVQAVAAEQALRYQRQARDSAEAGADLAARLAQVGNFSRLQRDREQAFHSAALLAEARAEADRVAARERLVRLLGLWGRQAADLKLPERLPDLPPQPADQPDIERQALAQRLDVQAARLQAEATAKNLGLSRVSGFVDVLELGYAHNTSNAAPPQTGYEISFELPLFDWSGARVAKAEAIYWRSVHRAAQAAVEARSEVRQAYSAYRTSWDIAHHYREVVVPTAQRVSEETLLRYNGMLVGVFDLLADARAQAASVAAAIDAQRDFWIAQADLEMAMVGKPALAGLSSSAAPSESGGPAH